MAESAETVEMQMPKFGIKLSSQKKAFEVIVPNGVQAQWEMERVRKNYPTSDEASTFWATWTTWAAAKKQGLIDTTMPFEAYMDELELITYETPVTANPTEQAAEDA